MPPIVVVAKTVKLAAEVMPSVMYFIKLYRSRRSQGNNNKSLR